MNFELVYFDAINTDNVLLVLYESLPYVGIMSVLIAIFFRRFYTKGSMISSILHLYLLVFMFQIWADAGHDLVSMHNYQLLMERVLLLAILLMTIIFSCRMKKVQAKIKQQLISSEYQKKRLHNINEHLKQKLRQAS